MAGDALTGIGGEISGVAQRRLLRSIGSSVPATWSCDVPPQALGPLAQHTMAALHNTYMAKPPAILEACAQLLSSRHDVVRCAARAVQGMHADGVQSRPRALAVMHSRVRWFLCMATWRRRNLAHVNSSAVRCCSGPCADAR